MNEGLNGICPIVGSASSSALLSTDFDLSSWRFEDQSKLHITLIRISSIKFFFQFIDSRSIFLNFLWRNERIMNERIIDRVSHTNHAIRLVERNSSFLR
jgi:hypothetical protein